MKSKQCRYSPRSLKIYSFPCIIIFRLIGAIIFPSDPSLHTVFQKRLTVQICKPVQISIRNVKMKNPITPFDVKVNRLSNDVHQNAKFLIFLNCSDFSAKKHKILCLIFYHFLASFLFGLFWFSLRKINQVCKNCRGEAMMQRRNET